MILEEEYMEIKSLKQIGLTNTEISKRLGISRKTVYNNLKKEKIPKYKRKKEIDSKLKEFTNYIQEKLKRHNLTSQKLFEDISKQGYSGSYGTVNNYVQKIKKTLRKEAYIRFETLPGEQAQVDWGYMGEIEDKKLGRRIKVYCFVMVLGYSRTTYIEFFRDMKIQNFLIGHNNAFNFFKGYTREILYDNLKSVVIKRKLKVRESEFNKKFIDFASYYGFKPILARPYKPETKGKVEKIVDYVKRNFYAGEEFISLKDINKRKTEWLEKINNRIHKTTKQIPYERLKKENLVSLENKKLYDTRIVYYRKVQKDIHFSFKSNFYSVPMKYVSKEVTILESSDNVIKVYYHNKLIVTHNLVIFSSGIYVTKKEHKNELEKYKYNFLNLSHQLQTTPSSSNLRGAYINLDIEVDKPNLENYERMVI